MMAQDQPHSGAEDELRQGKDREVPESEAQSDRQFSHAWPSSRIRYPTPRTVWISFGLPGESTLLRNRCMNASSVFSSISRSNPHTDSISDLRETTLPTRNMRRSSRLYS